MNDSNGLVFIVLIGLIIVTYMGVKGTALDSGPFANQQTNVANALPQQSPMPTQTSSTSPAGQSCVFPPTLSCQCIPPTGSLVSCQIYYQCPVGIYYRTVINGVDQPNMGCVVNTGASGLITYINDPSCTIACP